MPTLFDAIMKLGEINDVLHISSKTDLLLSQEQLTKLQAYKKLLEDTINIFIDGQGSTKSPLRVDLTNTMLEKMLKTIKVKDTLAEKYSHKFVNAVLCARKSATELLTNEISFTDTCAKIDFVRIQEIFVKTGQNDLEDMLRFNHIAKQFYIIKNALALTVEESLKFADNIFYFLKLAEEKFFNHEFFKTFDAEGEITLTFDSLSKRFTKLDWKKLEHDDSRFMKEIQDLLIVPVQRTMRYVLTFKEFRNRLDVLFQEKDLDLYNPIKISETVSLPKNIAIALLSTPIAMLEIKTRNINTAKYILESITEIEEKIAELQAALNGMLSNAFNFYTSDYRNNIGLLTLITIELKRAIEGKRYTQGNIISTVINECKEKLQKNNFFIDSFLNNLIEKSRKKFKAETNDNHVKLGQ